MILAELDVAGFRGFSEPARFDLRGNVIVIHGENGTGKTSFFDSIIWALTGCIVRFKDNETDVISRYAPTLSASVSLTLIDPSTKEEITVRRVVDATTKFISIERASGTIRGEAAESALQAMLSPNATGDLIDARSVHRRLTRSIYLQQDLVREFIDAADSAARFETISDLIGSGRALDLQERVENSRRAWSKHVNDLQARRRDMEKMQASLEAQISGLQVESNQLQMAQDQFGKWLIQHAALFADNLSQSEPSATDALAFLERSLTTITAREAALSHRQSATASLKDLSLGIALGDTPSVISEQLERRAAGKEEELAKGQTELQALLDHFTQQVKIRDSNLTAQQELSELAKLAIKHLGDECPVCTQSHDRERTIAHLRQLLGSVPQLSDADGGDLDVLRQQLSELRLRLTLEEQSLEEARTEISRLRQHKNEIENRREWIRERARELGFDPSSETSLDSYLARTLDQAEKDLGTLHAHRRETERLALLFAKLREANRRAALEEQLKDFKLQQEQLYRQSSRAELVQKVMTEIIEGIRDASISFTENCIAVVGPLVQKLYERIDPHPTFNTVKLWSRLGRGKGHLSTHLMDQQANLEERDPLRVLSSSQLNALAVSIFTALNIGVRGTPLNLLMLDEPLQSLDDLNLLGLIDSLRRLKDGRQLILSTHNTRLVELLSRKLRPTTETDRTIFYSFTNWSRSGPDVRKQEVPLAKRQLVVAA
jgi:DNA repair exonuclease SbcCD ATPase subunit